MFDFVADERNNYDPTITVAELLAGEPIGVGTRFRCTTAGHRPVEMIVEYDPPTRLVTATHLAGMDITSTLTYLPEGGGTRLAWSSDLRPRGPLRLLTPLMVRVGRRQTSAVWANLKTTLEAQPDAAEERS